MRLCTLMLLAASVLERGPVWASELTPPAQTVVGNETDTPSLKVVRLAWTYQSRYRPAPAFRGGLCTWRRLPRIEPIRYDYAFRPVASKGRLFFAASTEDAVFCLDAQTGALVWTLHVEGPVRLAPAVWEDRVYFGSDDGNVYCVDQATGNVVWQRRAAPDDRRTIGNGRVISAWPVRTRVAIADGTAYFGAGLFPPQGTYLCAVDARSGAIHWRRQIPYSPHGTILVDGDNLLVATGRTAPAEFRRSDGEPLEAEPNARRAEGLSHIGRAGDMTYWGPSESGLLHIRLRRDLTPSLSRDIASAVTQGRVVRLRGWQLLVDQNVYLVRDDQIVSISADTFRQLASDWWDARRQAAVKTPLVKQDFGVPAAGQLLRESEGLFPAIEHAAVWSVPNEGKYKSAVLNGRMLVVGGDGTVAALDAQTGKTVWSQPVEGTAWSVTVADDSVVVSTDQGWIYGFRPDATSPPLRHVPNTVAAALEDSDGIRATVRIALENTADRKGFCLVIGDSSTQLADAIARQSDFHVVVVLRDREQVAALRQRLTEVGMYGQRIVVHYVPDRKWDYPPYFANVIVIRQSESADPEPHSAESILRCLHPYGGTVVMDGAPPVEELTRWQVDGLSPWKELTGPAGHRYAVAHRGPLPGAGQWSHMYADPANTVCSGDRLVGPDLVLQWFGPPGADNVVERHAVAMPPLVTNGKLFVADANDTVKAIDAYNGVPLWKIEVPETTRQMMSHNAGFLAAGKDAVFVAGAKSCWMIDTQTGLRRHEFTGVEPEADWGYVGTTGDLLIGSNQKRPADEYSSGRRREGIKFLVNARELMSRPTVSNNLFAYAIRSRNRAWVYDNHSAILNATITIGDGTLLSTQ